VFTPASIVPVGAVAHSRLPADIQDERQVGRDATVCRAVMTYQKAEIGRLKPGTDVCLSPALCAQGRSARFRHGY
jgi:hypothetical protein